MPRSLDDLRRDFPHLGFSIYATDPSGPVLLEMMTDTGELFSFEGPTFAAAVTAAFGPEPRPVPAAPDPPSASPTPSVFD